MPKKDEKKVLAATSPEGETQLLVCKQSEEGEETCRQIGEKATDIGEEAPEGTTASSTESVDQKEVFDNNIYNLMEQLVTEKQSLWHIRNYYKDDAFEDDEIRHLWNFIEKDKQEIVKLLTDRLKERLEA